MSSTLSVCSKCDCLNNVDLNEIRQKKVVCGRCGSPLNLHGAVTEVDERNFWRVVRKADRPVIVDFWAEWCGPCKMYGPTFQQASLQTEKAIFLKVNTEANQQLAQQLGIRGIPATLVFDKGKEVRRQAGALTLEDVIALI